MVQSSPLLELFHSVNKIKLGIDDTLDLGQFLHHGFVSVVNGSDQLFPAALGALLFVRVLPVSFLTIRAAVPHFQARAAFQRSGLGTMVALIGRHGSC